MKTKDSVRNGIRLIPFCILLFPLNITVINAQWTRCSGPNTAYVTSMTVNGTDIFVGAFGSGVFRSTNNGTTWISVMSGFPPSVFQRYVLSITSVGTAIFAGTNDGLYRSTDVGKTWTNSSVGLKNIFINAIVPCRAGLLAGSENGLFRSIDNGSSWVPVGIGVTSPYISCLAVTDSNIFIGTYGNGIILSTDNGTTWGPVNNGLTTTRIDAIAIRQNVIIAGTYLGGIFRSTDQGSTWTSINGVPNGIRPLCIRDSIFFVGTESNGIYRSTDNGVHWNSVKTGIMPVNSLVVNGSDIFAGTNDNVFRSTDNGANWIESNLGLTNIVRSIAAKDSSVFVGIGELGVFQTIDLGSNWVSTALKSQSVQSFIVSDTNLYVGTSPGGVFRSNDNGKSWTPMNNGFTSYYLTVLSGNGKTFFAGTSRDGLFQSTDGGVNWSLSSPAAAMNYSTITSVAFNGSSVFAGTYGSGVFRTTDNGNTWSAINTGLTSFLVNSIVVKGSIVFVGTDGGAGVYRSTDNGSSWFLSNSGLSNPNIYSLCIGGNAIFAGCGIRDSTVFCSTNDGAMWTQVNNGMPALSAISPVLSFDISGTTLFAGTFGGGVWQRPLGQIAGVKIPALFLFPKILICGTIANNSARTVTLTLTNTGSDSLRISSISSTSTDFSVDSFPSTIRPLDSVQVKVSFKPVTLGSKKAYIVLKHNAFPSPTFISISGSSVNSTGVNGSDFLSNRYEVGQNYPNPFNPSTTISFSLPKTASVSLRIFNALGQEVALLVNEQKSPGNYQVQWNANVPSGIYFYRLQAGEFVETRKMIVLK